MTFVDMQVGDTDNDETSRFDMKRCFEFWICGDGIEITDIDTVGDDRDFFGLHTEMFGVEILDCFGVGEILSDKRTRQPFKDAGDKVFRVIVGGAEKGDDRRGIAV